MQVRDGPAAVRGDARRGNATGREAGKAAEGEPRVRRPAALPDSNPSRKEDSCFADSSLSRCFSWWRSPRLRSPPTSRSASKARRRRSSAQPSRRVTADNALQALDAASTAGEFYYGMTTSSFGDYVSQIGKYPASESTGWVFKVNGVSPPVGADKVTLKDGDVVLWYYATFGPAGGPPTLELQRLPANCYVVQSVTDAGKRTRSANATLARRRQALQDEERPRLHRQARRASCARPRPARSGRTPSSDPARARRARRPRPPRRLRWRRRGGGDGDAVGHARPRCRGAARREGRRGADADARARLEGRRSRRATAAASSRRSTVSPAASRISATGSGSSTATRATGARRPTGSATATSPGSTTAAGSGRERRASSSAPSRSRSCTATTGRRVPLPSASRARGRGADELAREIGAASVEPLGTPAPDGANVLELRDGPDGATAELLGQNAGDPFRLVLSGDPELTRRYEVR